MNKNSAPTRYLLITILALSGCTHTMTLESPTIDEPAMPWLDEAQYVTLLNGSTNRDEQACSNLVHKWITNEYELTELLITSLTQVYSKSNIHVQDNASKKLLLVISVLCNNSSGDMHIQIMVRTGDGLKINVGDGSWALFAWQVDEAFEKSLAHSTEELLANEDIIAYLSK